MPTGNIGSSGFGEWLRTLRGEKSLREFAAAMGIDPSWAIVAGVLESVDPATHTVIAAVSNPTSKPTWVGASVAIYFAALQVLGLRSYRGQHPQSGQKRCRAALQSAMNWREK